MNPDELIGYRERLGWSQSQLAEALGVHWNTWAKWERGVVAVAHPVILRLALERLAEALTRCCVCAPSDVTHR